MLRELRCLAEPSFKFQLSAVSVVARCSEFSRVGQRWLRRIICWGFLKNLLIPSYRAFDKYRLSGAAKFGLEMVWCLPLLF
jgi:hypothetical protein